MKKDNQEISKATLDDYVFEDRNRAYGAYFLRQNYGKRLLQGLLLAIFIFISLFLLSMAFRKKEVPKPKPIKKKEEFVVYDIPVDLETPPAPPLPKLEVPKLETIKFVTLVATKEEIRKEHIATQEELKEKTAAEETKEGEKNNNGENLKDNPLDGSPDGAPDGKETDEVWLGAVTKETEFPGGKAALSRFISEQIDPSAIEYAMDRGYGGKSVFIHFTVTREGSIIDVSVVKGREIAGCKICTEAALKVVEKMKWAPAENNGMKVKRYVTMPITFPRGQ